jgi:hypothetical protein
MDTETRNRVELLLLEEGQNAIFTTFGRLDQCVAGTALGIGVLEHFGIPAEPLPVRLMIWNALASRFIAEKGTLPMNGDPDWEGAVKEGAWTLGVGWPNPTGEPSKWDGHLVIVAPGVMIDLTLGQVNRPAKGIQLSASRFVWPDNATVGMRIPITREDGLTVVYSPSSDSRWKAAPPWKDRNTSGFRRLTGRVIRRISERLEAEQH